MKNNRAFVCIVYGLLAVAFLSASGCKKTATSGRAEASGKSSTVTIAAIGDSLTWGALAFGPKAASGGYPTIVETLLRQDGHEVVVFNKGIPGEKAFQTQARFEAAIADADIALLMIGVNDIIRPEGCPEPNNCRTNAHIETMIVQAEKANIPLFVSTLTPAQDNCARSWVNEPVTIINARLRAYAQEHDVLLVDNHAAILDHGKHAIYSDCLHFTDDGYRVLAEAWYQHLAPYLTKTHQGT